MPKQSTKLVPSDLDYEVWQLMYLKGYNREEAAKHLKCSTTTIDYHIAESKRLIGLDVTKVKDDFQKLMIPISFDGLRLIHKAFKSMNPKYLDGAIKFLRNAGYTIEQQEVNHIIKDSRNADVDFDAVYDKFKERAIDAVVSDPITSNDDRPAADTHTATSPVDDDVSILPFPESHGKNPKHGVE